MLFYGRSSLFALLAGGFIAALLISVPTSARQNQTSGTAQPSQPIAKEVLDKYCITCHNQRLRTAGLSLDNLDVTRPASNPEVWERVVAKLRAGSMPPAGRPRPDAATYHTVAAWLETEIDRTAASSPNPGRINAVQHLNRVEYNNAILDLF